MKRAELGKSQLSLSHHTLCSALLCLLFSDPIPSPSTSTLRLFFFLLSILFHFLFLYSCSFIFFIYPLFALSCPLSPFFVSFCCSAVFFLPVLISFSIPFYPFFASFYCRPFLSLGLKRVKKRGQLSSHHVFNFTVSHQCRHDS